MSGVLRLDLRDYSQGESARRQEFCERLKRGMMRYGFIRLVGHGIESDLLSRCYGHVEEYFARDIGEKRLDGDSPGGQRGYTAMGVEHAKDHPVGDLKEFFHVGREIGPLEEPACVYPPNRWPKALPEFRTDFLALYDRLDRCSALILEALAHAHGLPPSRWSGLVRRGNSILRLLHYPPTAPPAPTAPIVPRAPTAPTASSPPIGAHDQATAYRAAPHEDINLITLLCAATDEGLEILEAGGAWLPVAAEEGELVVDAGDMLSRITNNRIPSTTHRVVARPVQKLGRCERSGISGTQKDRGAMCSAHFQHADWSMFGLMNTLQLQLLILIFAGWVNRSQQDVIEYLQEENRVLREQLGGKRLLFTDRQRRLLAAKAKAVAAGEARKRFVA